MSFETISNAYSIGMLLLFQYVLLLFLVSFVICKTKKLLFFFERKIQRMENQIVWKPKRRKNTCNMLNVRNHTEKEIETRALYLSAKKLRERETEREQRV